MSRIVVAVNSMITNAQKLSNIKRKDSEYYFLYDNKYKWSISESDEKYHLFFYPGDQTIDELVKTTSWSSVTFVSYSSDELKTREALESFRELYLIIKEKLYGVDKALDDIIGS